MISRTFSRALVAVFVLVSMLCQGTMVLAGTTGQITGTAVDSSTNAPIAGAKVTVASPSQLATATTDSGGHFSFLSLIPDTYVVSISRQGYEDTSISGVTVAADNSRTVNLTVGKALRTIGEVRTRAAGSLVKPGTTSDVYSIDAPAQSKASVAGGGGTQNSAFSALSTVPGVFVAPGQSGYIGAGPSLSIRGGDYDQIGYEIDGVPVNRAFDNYPSGPASSLGQQELQVYTGGGPASSEAQGLSGFINQVIRTGTNPGFVLGDVSIGGPTFYHKASLEIGGATTNRNFSYYVGVGGYDQDFRFTDQYNGVGVGQLYGMPLVKCPAAGGGVTAATVPSCFAPNGSEYGTGVNLYNSYFGTTNAFVLGSNNLFGTSEVIDRDNVINLHLAIPRKNGLKDDIQLLGMVNALKTYTYDSTNDQGGAAYLNLIGEGQPFYIDGLIYHGATGTTLPANYQSLIGSQNFPHSADPTGRQTDSNVPVNLQDDFVNDQGIIKLQLTHPFSENALFKIYGYTYYSDWLQTGAQSTYSNYLASVSPDYELSSHTRGLSGTFIDQLNAQNLVQLQGSYTTATALRDNNTGFLDAFGGARANFATLVDSSNPTNGICYSLNKKGVQTPTSCADANVDANGGPGVGVVENYSLQDAQAGLPAATGTCGGGPCEYLITGNGQYATFNTVKTIFYAASLTDDFHPTSKIAINGGLRMDIFQYQGGSTAGTAARTFYYNAFNQDNCLGAGGALVAKEPTDACPAGTTAANFQNPQGIVTESYTEFEPRLGGTYTVDPSTVLRASYGRYSQAPNSAFQQYNTLQQNAPATLY
ncbi:MAG: carboxypeptidase regulatory-like domain-containing protein, partial [Candidatus Eremiobacteraeota bacterium]|nr:carboxypeptidase regulatory-like domain-containing protein [Candidatus Eremiobacteraeota bacterium]